MTVALRLLDDDEAAALAPVVERQYAEDIETNGGLAPEDARRKAAQDVPGVLADSSNDLFAVEDDGEQAGFLWVGERSLQGRRVLWIWDVFVEKEHRGRGLGRRAMQLAEEEARRRGLERIELNVFGGNEIARSLYRSLDYDEVAVMMGKKVS